MPQPAYQPKDAPRGNAVRIEDDASAFVAPRAPRPGQPAPEVMDRLRRAVENHGQTARPAAPQPQPQQPNSRMSGLGRMLERMAGHGGEGAAKPPAASIAERISERVAVRARQQEADFDDLASPDNAQDNVEIPAFLRRQAN